MRSFTVLALAGLAALVTSTPVAPPLPHAIPRAAPVHMHARQSDGTNSTAPCAQVSQALYKSGVLPTNKMVPAKMAYDCINSVPFNATSAKALLAALPAYLQWQSTLDTLKNPPAEYVEKVQPAADILAGLAQIGTYINAGKYNNEYEFGWDLYRVILAAHDGHFTYVPDSVGNVFSFGRPVPLVSVSEDGALLPSVYVFKDVLGIQFKNVSYTPSAVVEIDGEDAHSWLENWAQYNSLQDRDAGYNALFYNLAQVSLGANGVGTGVFTGGGRGRFVYPGATTTLKFANGTSYTMDNYAIVSPSFRGVNTGQDLADRVFYFTAEMARTATKAQTEVASPKPSVDIANPVGYPTPVQYGPLGVNTINGYFIDAPGYEDVAVLSMVSFVNDGNSLGFQRTARDFFAKAVAAGKTKLVIDVQANGGGTILLAHDLFKQLFPSADPYNANRFPYSEAVDLIGQSYSAYSSRFPRVSAINNSAETYQMTYFDYHTDMTAEGQPFESWAEKVGPVETNGDKYTSVHRWNLSDVLISDSTGGINITGYGPLANLSTAAPPFKAENIVLLTDGYCASTCTIFSEFLTTQAGIKTIAMGGRSNKNKIQAIGGVKGTNNYQYWYIQNLAQSALRIAPSDQAAKFNASVLRTDYTSNVPFNRGALNGINVRDGVRLNDTSGVALQFIYEEADCRLYYTPEMTTDVTAIWKAAADAQWGSKVKCINGGGYGKRESREVTSKLKPRRIQLSQAVAAKKVAAFEATFSLETDCKLEADGFMQP